MWWPREVVTGADWTKGELGSEVTSNRSGGWHGGDFTPVPLPRGDFFGDKDAAAPAARSTCGQDHGLTRGNLAQPPRCAKYGTTMTIPAW